MKRLGDKVAEVYAYDPASKILSKTIDGKTTCFKYDNPNMFAFCTDANVKVTNYSYDAV